LDAANVVPYFGLLVVVVMVVVGSPAPRLLVGRFASCFTAAAPRTSPDLKDFTLARA
jgi:hypothetical protein